MSGPADPILALDSASPVVSVAIGEAEGPIAERTIPLRRSSELLLRVIAELLAEAECALASLGGIVVLQGPGSFTGLRIGLGTVLGLHQALDLRATALPSLGVLATAAGEPAAGEPAEVLAAVDAMRGDWYVQRFRLEAGPVPLSEAGLRPGGSLGELAPCRLVGFELERLAGEPWWGEAEIEVVEPPALAPLALRFAFQPGIEWDAARLTQPIYFRPPAVTVRS